MSGRSKRATRSDARVRKGRKIYEVRPIGFVRSSLKRPEDAPMQGEEGAPDAWVELERDLAEGLDGIAEGQEIVLITWLHQARRDLLKLHPRDDPALPLAGVFATRSPARPNPLGLHPVRVRAVEGSKLRVGPLEAVDGTPVVDIKGRLRRRKGGGGPRQLVARDLLVGAQPRHCRGTRARGPVPRAAGACDGLRVER